MKQIVRNKTFETNSSSMHSISIFDGTNNIEKLKEFDSKKLTIDVDQYGWENAEYTTPIDILRYLWTYVVYYAEKYIEKVKAYLPNTNFILPEKDPDDHFSYDRGYIDHGRSYDGDINSIFEDEGNFAQVLFNGRIATTNDNSYYDEEYNWLHPSNAKKVIYKGN